ncbi:MAG: hypothetical protein ACPGSD_07730 [Flavobacteriales bacterium]
MKKKETSVENALICGLDETAIDALKAEHGFLILGTVKQGGDVFHVIFKEPSTKVLKAIETVEKTDKLQASINMFNNCMVKCDDEIRDRDYLKIRSVESVVKHMQSFSVEVKNL